MTIQSVHRAIDILSLFSVTQPRLGITDMSRSLGLPKPTVHGLVQTLMQRGFLTQDPETKKYSVGMRIFELGTILAGSLKINQVAAAPTQRLASETGLAARIAIWDEDSVLVTLNLFPAARNIQFNQLGPRVPAYCTAIGKAILAWLPEAGLDAYLKQVVFIKFTQHTLDNKAALLEDLDQVRRRGYAEDREEYLMGLACISLPLFDYTGRPVGSVSLSGSSSQIFDQPIEEKARYLSQTAMEISRYLGHQPGVTAIT